MTHESSFRDHEAAAEANAAMLRFAVVTVSDTRTEATDRSGQAARALIAEAGHDVCFYALVRDEPEDIRRLLQELLSPQHAAQVIVTNGGTGISLRDSTCEVIRPLLDRTLDGFGELFRAISFQQIGSAAMLSRAVGGISHGKLIFATPGSTNAVRTALTELILPQARHLWNEIRKHAPSPRLGQPDRSAKRG